MKAIEHVRNNTMVPAEYPSVHLDTYAYCNGRCIFCGYPSMKRAKGQMPRELLRHIVEDIASWSKPMEEIVPIHYGEFFLNPDWLYALQCIEGNLPNTKIAIPTNGSVLTDDKIDELVKIRTVHYISFSVYGYFDETYERLIGLNSDTIKKIEHAIVRIRQLRPDIHIQVGTTTHPPFITEYELGLFIQKWHPYARPHVLIGNSQVNTKFAKDYPSEIPCSMVFVSLMVLWDGRVSLCCFNPEGEMIVGDVKKEKLLDIWRGKLTREYQELHAEGKRDAIPLCRSCSFAC